MATYEVHLPRPSKYSRYCLDLVQLFHKQSADNKVAEFSTPRSNHLSVTNRYYFILLTTFLFYYLIFFLTFISPPSKNPFIESYYASASSYRFNVVTARPSPERLAAKSFPKLPHALPSWTPSYWGFLSLKFFKLSGVQFTKPSLVVVNKSPQSYKAYKRGKKKTQVSPSTLPSKKEAKTKNALNKTDENTALNRLLRGETNVPPIPGMEKLISAIDTELGSVTQEDIDAVPFVKWKQKLQETPPKGYHLPYDLVTPEKWELLKLFGRLGDPHWPLRAAAISSNLLLDRLFRGKEKIDEHTFKSQIEWKWNFLMPSGKCFEEINEICWQSWMCVRNLTEHSMENAYRRKPFDNKEEKTSIDLATVIRRVNKEINQQGIHPAVLNAFWTFLAGHSQPELTRRQMAMKLFHTCPHQRKSVYILSADEFEKLFMESLRTALTSFNETAYQLYHEEVLQERRNLQNSLQKNAALRRSNKQFAYDSREKIENALFLNNLVH